MTKARTPRGARRPIKFGGTLYPSINAASEATGVSWSKLSNAAAKGQSEINRLYQAYLVATPKAEIESRDFSEFIKHPMFVAQAAKWGKEMEALEQALDDVHSAHETALNANEEQAEELAQARKDIVDLGKRLRKSEDAWRDAAQDRKLVESQTSRIRDLQSEMRGMLRVVREMSGRYASEF